MTIGFLKSAFTRLASSPFLASNAHQSTMDASASSVANLKNQSLPPMNGKKIEFMTMMIENTAM